MSKSKTYLSFLSIFRMEYDREMIDGKLNEINKSFIDQIQSQTEGITAQVQEFEQKLVSAF